MTPRRVLLRIKKLRRFLDERILESVRAREDAGDEEARAEAAGRLEAYQRVRGEMVGERLEPGEIELRDEPEGADGPGAAEASEEVDEPEGAAAGG